MTHDLILRYCKQHDIKYSKKGTIWNQPKAAAVQCANINPELIPPSFTRKAGNPLKAVKLQKNHHLLSRQFQIVDLPGLINLSVRLSLIEESSWTAMLK